ncbi:MAG: IS66 family transposase [Polaromonas sp.]
MTQPTLVYATKEQIDGLLALAKVSFPQDEYALLEKVLETFVYVMLALQNAKTSLKRFRHMLFGKKTESKKNLFGHGAASGAASALEGAASAGVPALGEPADGGDKKKKGHGRNGASKYSAANIVRCEHDGLKPGDACPVCHEGKVYGCRPKIIIKIVGQPSLGATAYVLDRLRCHLCDTFFIASMPKGINERKYEACSGSILACLRYGSGMPFHRLDKLQASMGIPMPDATQWDLVKKTADAGPRHVFNELIKQAGQARLLHNDDTPARILSLMGERRAKAEAAGEEMPTTKAINTTGIVALLPGEQKTRVILFFTGAAHAGQNLQKILAHRASELGLATQMCDALAANIIGDIKTNLSLCNSHARRKIVEVAENFPEPCRYVIEVFASVYQHDGHCKDEKMTDQQRLVYHQDNSGPLMRGLKTWMDQQLAEKLVEPNSGLGHALRYMLKNWAGLTLFLRLKGVPLDNNIAERILKWAITHRKNSYFYRSPKGAEVGDIFMSLIYTCQECNVSPFEYLQILQKNHEAVRANAQLWLPWNYHETLAAKA